MKLGLLVPFVASAAALGVEASSSMDAAWVAIARLEEAPNFAWRSTILPGGSTVGPPISGQRVRNGYTVIRMDTPGEVKTTIGFADRSVSETQYGWLSPDQSQRLYQIAATPPFRTPVQELTDMVQTCSRLSMAGNVISGTFDARTAKTMWMIVFGMDRGGWGSHGTGPFFQDAKGDFRIWLQNGQITRYELHLEGLLTPGCFSSPMNITRLTEIDGIGTTRVSVPYEARAALDDLDQS